MVDVTKAKEKYSEATSSSSYTAGLEEFAKDFAEGGPFEDKGPLSQLEGAFASSVTNKRKEYSKGVARFINQSDDASVNSFDIDDVDWFDETVNSDWASKSLRSASKYSVNSSISKHKWFNKYADAYTSDE